MTNCSKITIWGNDTYDGDPLCFKCSVPDEDNEGEYEKADEWEGHGTGKWSSAKKRRVLKM